MRSQRREKIWTTRARREGQSRWPLLFRVRIISSSISSTSTSTSSKDEVHARHRNPSKGRGITVLAVVVVPPCDANERDGRDKLLV